MTRLDQAKELWDRATAESDLSTLERATAIWSKAAEAEKVELESSELNRGIRSENVRFWIPLIATLISSTALVGTLLFQIGQFKENTRLQTEAAEDSQYREVLKTVQSPDMMHGAVGLPLLKSFFESPRYGKQAREVALRIMGGIVDYDTFQSLFEPIEEKTDWSNYRGVVRVEAVLYDSWRGWRDDLEKLEGLQKNAPKTANALGRQGLQFPGYQAEPTLNGARGPRTLPEVKRNKEQTEKELLFCEDFLIQLLKTQRPTGLAVDLSGPSAVYLGGKDLSNLNFNGAILDEVVLDSSRLDGLDLSDVTKFDQSTWDDVAWWRAVRISAPLLKYLTEQYPYSSEGKYGRPVTLDEYKAELSRLKAASVQRSGGK